jgi:hypothetical protein
VKAIAFVIALLIISVAHSQTANKSVPPIAGKTEASDKKGSESEGKKEISVSLPSSLNVTVGGKVDVVSDQKNPAANAEPSKFTDPIVWLTFVLAVAHVHLWLTTKSIANEAKAASGIAKTSVELSRLALVVSQRAWMVAKKLKVERGSDENGNVKWEFIVIWQNAGNTPALNVKMGHVLKETKPGARLVGIKTSEESSYRMAVGAKQTVRIRIAKNAADMSMDQAQRLMREEIQIFLAASAAYHDIFNESELRETTVCHKISVGDKSLSGNPFMFFPESDQNKMT